MITELQPHDATSTVELVPDDRPHAQPDAAIMVDMRAEEVWAQECVQRELPKSSVMHHDDNTEPGMFDLKITHPDGTTAAVEITAAADAKQVELWKLVSGRGERWIVPDLAGGWAVQVRPSSRWKTLHPHLPQLLRAAEQAGTTFIPGRASSTDPLSTLADQLGIVQAWQGPTAHPGSIYVIPEQPFEEIVGFVPSNGDPLAQWISAWIADASRADNLRKLANSGAHERHLFVLVSSFSRAPFAVHHLLLVPGAPPPTTPPDLPDAITHLWTMSMWSTGDGFRWSPDKGWTRFAKVV